MEASSKILRRSIHGFLQNYHYFTSTSAVLAFPFSVSVLILQALISSSSSSSSSVSLLPQLYTRLRILFEAAGFPSSSQLINILNLKVSQTIISSIFTLPFTLTFFLFAKASVMQAINHHKLCVVEPSFSSIASLYKPLLNTYVFSTFLIISANSLAFCLLFLAFGIVEGMGFSPSPSFLLVLSASGVVLFSVILANALVICNLAMAVSGMEGHGGYLTILKACVMMSGRTSMALFLALPVNVALAAIEALFQFRVVRVYHSVGKPGPLLALEGIFIAYLYSIFIVLDTIISCMFYKSCMTESWMVDREDREEKNFEQIP